MSGACAINYANDANGSNNKGLTPYVCGGSPIGLQHFLELGDVVALVCVHQVGHG